MDVARYLLEQGADRDKAFLGSNRKYTPLHIAAYGGHLGIAKLLMLYGADLNARATDGRLPIDMARTEEMKQAIRNEPRRRMDEAPGKRATEQDRHPISTTSATSLQQEEKEEEESSKKRPRFEEEAEGKAAEEDEDSEPSSDEELK